MTYYPIFKNVRKTLKELHLLVSPDQAYKRVFSEVPIIGFKNAKTLKDHLVRAVTSIAQRGQINHVKYATQLKILQNLKKQKKRVRRNF